MMLATVDRVADLPEAALDGDGVWTARFRSVGIRSFHGACRWAQALPYGANLRPDAAAVFEEGRGTCRSKHGAVALLAAEVGLPVDRYVGAYRMDASIAPGVREILDACGLTFVPQLHCVLGCGERFVDLTAGNRHGKARDVGQMDLYLRTGPFPDAAADERLFALAVAYYQAVDPVMASCRLSIDEVRQVARACLRTSALARAAS